MTCLHYAIEADSFTTDADAHATEGQQDPPRWYATEGQQDPPRWYATEGQQDPPRAHSSLLNNHTHFFLIL